MPGEDNKFSKVRTECLKLMLGPIARFCLRNSSGIQDFLEISKQVFISAAEKEIENSGDKVNVSRLSLMTGIHRRDVMRIYKEGSTKESPENVTMRVIGQWTQDPEFLTKQKKPRILSFEGEDNQFKSLVEKVSKDINPGTVLFELDRVDAVEKSSSGLKLQTASYFANSTNLEGYRIMARDAEDLMYAVDENISSELEVPNLHARTEYDNIAPDSLPEIQSWLLKEGSKFHRKVREFLAKYDADINPELKGSEGAKVVVGSFARQVKSKK